MNDLAFEECSDTLSACGDGQDKGFFHLTKDLTLQGAEYLLEGL